MRLKLLVFTNTMFLPVMALFLLQMVEIAKSWLSVAVLVAVETLQLVAVAVQ
jgi:hypothetical protein